MFWANLGRSIGRRFESHSMSPRHERTARSPTPQKNLKPQGARGKTKQVVFWIDSLFSSIPIELCFVFLFCSDEANGTYRCVLRSSSRPSCAGNEVCDATGNAAGIAAL
jgi:hypothetical protein